MAATGTPTPNIGLRCPVGTDPASVDDINYNSGVIDTKLGAVGSTSVQDQIDALNSKLGWKNGGSVTGSATLTLPTANWKEACIVLACHGSVKKTLTKYIPNNSSAEARYSIVGYVSATELSDLSWSGSARFLWVSVYANQAEFKMMEANSEETVNNYAMRVWYKE